MTLPPDLEYHLQRLRMGTTDRMSRKDTSKWIAENTYIGGRKWSFKDHEFQLRIADETATEIVVAKAAQLGVSELSLRMALAWMMFMPAPFSIAYTFPTATFASQYSRTRWDPIIASSPAARAALAGSDISNSEIKSFGPERTMFFKGAATGNAAISDSLHAIYHDELDFSDQDVIGSYSSRLIHSPYKWRVKISTPTSPGGPIMSAFENTQQWFNMCRCHHCGHTFWPSYYDHLVIDGFNGHLDEISQDNLHRIDAASARIICPQCGKAPSLQPQHREWVCANPDEGREAVGIRLSPFDSPNVVTARDLVVSSTTYASKARFRQFALGQPAVDAESGLTEDDVRKASVDAGTSPGSTHFMGIDQGNVCHFMVGCLTNDGTMVIVHYERAPLSRLKERYWALKTQYRVTAVVIDSQPNLSAAMELAEADSQCYPALYTTRAGMDLFDVRSREANPEEGIMALRQVSINRNALFDKLLLDIREGRTIFHKRPDWDILVTHLTDMKRAQATLRSSGEFQSVWTKQRGTDHLHHALAYTYVAAQLRGIVSTTVLPSMFTVQKFKVTEPKSRRA